MGFIKCPRCELNYIREEEQYCPVCKREMKGESHNDPFELCSICNENPVMPGKDVCYACYKEMTQQQGSRRDDEMEESDTSEVSLGMEDVSEMDEIELGGHARKICRKRSANRFLWKRKRARKRKTTTRMRTRIPERCARGEG